MCRRIHFFKNKDLTKKPQLKNHIIFIQDKMNEKKIRLHKDTFKFNMKIIL